MKIQLSYKRIITLISVLILALVLVSCEEAPQQGEQLQIYFLKDYSASPGSAVDVVEITISRNSDKVTHAMKKLLADPGVSGLVSPFPKGISLSSVKYDGEKVIIGLSEEYGELYGADLAAADACVVLTLCAIEGISEVELTVNGEPHPSRPHKTMSASGIVTDDLPLKPVEMEIVLYFTDGNRQYVVPEVKNIIIRDNESIERYVVEELLKGPVSDGLERILPEGTELISIAREKGTCFVNFSEAFMRVVEEGREAEIQALYSVTNSLCSINGIQSVQYLVDGQRLYGSTVMLPYNASVGEFSDLAIEATVYMADSSATYLVPVKARIATGGGFDLSRLLTDRLITGIDGGGFMSILPKGTMILDMEIGRGSCTINFSKEFIQNNTGAVPDVLILQSIALTLNENIESIDHIIIKVDGQDYGNGELIKPDREKGSN